MNSDPESSLLDLLIPAPGLLEVDYVDLATTPSHVWERVRHGELATSPLIRALFALRTLPDRLLGKGGSEGALSLRIDGMVSSLDRPGFGILAEDPGREVCVGAIGRVWEPNIPFVYVEDAAAFASFDRPGYVKVAWALRVTPRGNTDARCTVEVRVGATDEGAWRRFRRYFRLIGPGSRFIRKSLLDALVSELGGPGARYKERPLPGDELLPDAAGEFTHGVDIEASPEAIWPWLVQMGCGRAGFYSVDWLDNAGIRSAREIHPDLQEVSAGDVLPASPGSDEGFEVLRVERPSVLLLGGLFDRSAGRQLPFAAARPDHYWHVTWAFVLEALDERTTRLHVRARGAFPPGERLHAAWITPVHHFMQRSQLRHLKARAEGGLRRDDIRDVASGAGGAALMAASLLTPFLRGRRSRWGLGRDEAERAMPGDELMDDPRWSWTHGIEIDAPAEEVWPWVAQIGADRGGFYSYQWLENLVGVDVRNAETIHPEWQIGEGDGLLLHPSMPPLPIVEVEPGRFMLAHAADDAQARHEGRPWVEVTWLFLVEDRGNGRSRLISRYRATCSDDLATRLSFGPTLLEPIGFAMDRRMLLGIKERAERR